MPPSFTYSKKSGYGSVTMNNALYGKTLNKRARFLVAMHLRNTYNYNNIGAIDILITGRDADKNKIYFHVDASIRNRNGNSQNIPTEQTESYEDSNDPNDVRILGLKNALSHMEPVELEIKLSPEDIKKQKYEHLIKNKNHFPQIPIESCNCIYCFERSSRCTIGTSNHFVTVEYEGVWKLRFYHNYYHINKRHHTEDYMEVCLPYGDMFDFSIYRLLFNSGKVYYTVPTDKILPIEKEFTYKPSECLPRGLADYFGLSQRFTEYNEEKKSKPLPRKKRNLLFRTKRMKEDNK